jgi:hypothetical protein
MHKLIAALTVVPALAAGAWVFAQGLTGRAAIEKQLIANERTLNEAFAKRM